MTERYGILPLRFAQAQNDKKEAQNDPFCHPEGVSPKGLIKGGDSSVAVATSE